MREWVMAAAIALSACLGVEVQQAQAAQPTSDFCKRWYKDISSKPAKRALALSEDGKTCHSVWGVSSQGAADRQAVHGCQDGGKRKCSVARR